MLWNYFERSVLQHAQILWTTSVPDSFKGNNLPCSSTMEFSSRSSQNHGVVAQVTCSVVGTAAAVVSKSISYSACEDLNLGNGNFHKSLQANDISPIFMFE